MLRRCWLRLCRALSCVVLSSCVRAGPLREDATLIQKNREIAERGAYRRQTSCACRRRIVEWPNLRLDEATHARQEHPTCDAEYHPRDRDHATPTSARQARAHPRRRAADHTTIVTARIPRTCGSGARTSPEGLRCSRTRRLPRPDNDGDGVLDVDDRCPNGARPREQSRLPVG